MRSGIRPVEVLELDGHARRVLARRHPYMAGYPSALVIAVDDAMKDEMVRTVHRLADAVNHDRRTRLDDLIDELTPFGEDTLRFSEEACRQVQFRHRMLREHAAYTAADIGRQRGSTAADPGQVATRWRNQGRIFAVRHQGKSLYFTFQFDDQLEPRPVIRDVVKHLHDWDPWDIAIWFVTPNGALNRRQPVDLLADRSANLAKIAQQASRMHKLR